MKTKKLKKPKCYWCNNQAEMKDYRTIDSTTSKIITCKNCAGLSTEYLLERRYKKKEE